MRRAVLIAMLLLAGCTPAEIVSRDGGAGDAGRPDAGEPDAGPADDAGVCEYEPVDREGEPPGCELRRPPGRPTCDPADDQPARWFVLRSIDFHLPRAEGVDLDGFCTEEPDGPSDCVPPDMAHALDGAEGIDNVFETGFISSFEFVYRMAYGSSLEEDVNASLARGFRNLAIRVGGWSHEPDDPGVAVDFANTVCGLPTGDASACPLAPPIDAIDFAATTFHPDEGSFVGGDLDTAVVRDPGAYVSDGRLVARLASTVDLVFPTRNGTVRLDAQGAVMVADIDPETEVITGFIAGRWVETSALQTAESFGLCVGSTGYDAYRDVVRQALDTVASGVGGPAVPCDALSAIVGFEAVGANVATEARPSPPVSDACP